MMSNFIVGGVLAGVIVIGGLITGLSATSHVPVGSVGIVKHMNGQVSELPQGWHITGFGVSVQDYPTYMQSLILSSNAKEGGSGNEQWTVGTSDQQELPVNSSLTWKINVKDATNIYQNVGGKDINYISDKIVQPTMKNVVNRITHDYSWNDIKGAKQGEITDKIQKQLGIELAKVGITIGNFGFTYVGTPQGMAQSQQTLASSELAVKQAQAKQQQQAVENQTAIQKAEADAQQKQIQAEAEAKANQIVSQSLTPELVEYNKVSKWNGTLPTTMLGNNTSVLANVK